MLSILIPVNNYDVTNLVKDLHSAASFADIEFEILIGDDGSLPEYKSIYHRISTQEKAEVLTLAKNSGRSVIRNRLADRAKNRWLLFIDADLEIPGKDYIADYLPFVNDEMLVICGGRSYAEQKPANSEFFLHWKYGMKREVKPASFRNKNPWSGFQSNNFLISKEVYKTLAFNEQIVGYGHEDTLFGLDLKRNNLKILHIDNPAVHAGLERSAIFLAKAREGVRNLRMIYELHHEIKYGKIRLLSAYLFFRRLGMRRIFNFLFIILRRKIEINLKGKRPCLYLFDLYRLMFAFSAG